MYYTCSENKDADQLRGYREADLRLCFRPCKLLVFSRTGSFKKSNENKGTDQLCSYCTINLQLCFRRCKNLNLSCSSYDFIGH